MSLYTLVFLGVTLLILIGLGIFGFFIYKLDKWIDRRERLGSESIYKSKKNDSKPFSGEGEKT